MTAERGLVYTSRGEVVRDLADRPVRRAALGPYHPFNDPRRELQIMARGKAPATPFERTPGAPAPDEIDDTPLRVGPPDALIEEDRTPYDVVPDLDEKGFHVGLVPQPASRIGTPENTRGFEATGERRSKFDNGADLASLKRAHNESEASDPRYEGVAHVAPIDGEELLAQERAADEARAPKAAKG
jgi:hypothetical protein